MKCLSQSDPLMQVGNALLRGVAKVYTVFPDLWNWSAVILVLGVALLGVVIYRMTRSAASRAWKQPRLYRTANGPFVAPLAVMLGSIGAAFVVPGYLRGAEAFRPEWWPALGNLDYLWVARGLPFAFLLTIFGFITFISRIWREKVIRSRRGMAHWAAWRDVSYHKDWRFLIPIFVHYRGTAWEWVKGAGRTLLALAEETCCRHLFLVGQTGSAKGFGIFGPIIASTRMPFIYQDFKGICTGHDLLKERTGLEPIRWGAAAIGGWPSQQWNPLEEARRSSNPVDQFTFLAGLLIPSRGKDDWVSELARPILAWIFARGDYHTLGEVYDDLVQEGVPAVLGKSGVPGGLLAALEGKNVKEYLGTTIFSAMGCFGGGWCRSTTSGHDFNIDEIFQRGGYVLSAESDITKRVPLTIFWRFIIGRIVSSNRYLGVTLLFDEALAAGRIPDVSTVLETARSKGVAVVFGVQHTAGVRRVYEHEADGLMSGFAGRITLLNGLSTQDQKLLQESLGKCVVEEADGRGKKDRIVVDLLTSDDLSRRANQFKKFWVVIDTNGATRTGTRILGQLVGAGGLDRPPSKEEALAEVATAVATTDYILQPTPGLAQQVAARNAAEEEVSGALTMATDLTALLARPVGTTLREGRTVAPVSVTDIREEVAEPGFWA